MLDDAALALEEIAPEDRRFDPGTASWWISLAYAVRRTESVERAEAILLRAQANTSQGCHDRIQPCLLCERRRRTTYRQTQVTAYLLR
jgi:hypothetical protein